MAGTEWKVDKHLNTMTITFPTSPRVVIRWSADQVDDHLRKLGELRSKMKPPHPRNFALGQVVRGIANAPWATETDTMLGNSILHIRDPRYGWLHFLFSKEDARKLATLLQKQVDSPTCHTVRQLRQVLCHKPPIMLIGLYNPGRAFEPLSHCLIETVRQRSRSELVAAVTRNHRTMDRTRNCDPCSLKEMTMNNDED